MKKVLWVAALASAINGSFASATQQPATQEVRIVRSTIFIEAVRQPGGMAIQLIFNK